MTRRESCTPPPPPGYSSTIIPGLGVFQTACRKQVFLEGGVQFRKLSSNFRDDALALRQIFILFPF